MRLNEDETTSKRNDPHSREKINVNRLTTAEVHGIWLPLFLLCSFSPMYRYYFQQSTDQTSQFGQIQTRSACIRKAIPRKKGRILLSVQNSTCFVPFCSTVGGTDFPAGLISFRFRMFEKSGDLTTIEKECARNAIAILGRLSRIINKLFSANRLFNRVRNSLFSNDGQCHARHHRFLAAETLPRASRVVDESNRRKPTDNWLRVL